MGIKLKEVFEKLLTEQPLGAPMPPLTPQSPLPSPAPGMMPGAGMGMPPPPLPSMVPPPAGMPPQGAAAAPPTPPIDRDVVNLPGVNMNVSFFTGEKKMVFSPQDHEAFTEKIKKYVDLFKKSFRINSIKSLDKGSFEIEFDPRENFTAAVQFLQQLAQHDQESAI